MDFIVMDLEEDEVMTLILGKPFMEPSKVVIDVDGEKMSKIMRLILIFLRDHHCQKNL